MHLPCHHEHVGNFISYFKRNARVLNGNESTEEHKFMKNRRELKINSAAQDMIYIHRRHRAVTASAAIHYKQFSTPEPTSCAPPFSADSFISRCSTTHFLLSWWCTNKLEGAWIIPAVIRVLSSYTATKSSSNDPTSSENGFTWVTIGSGTAQID